jgi:hypothetical protein
MNRAHIVLACVFILFVKTSSEAYVSGHSKFFRDSTQTTVDLLYDTHVEYDFIPRTKTGKVDIAAKNLLSRVHPTERKVMAIFDHFSAAIPGSIDVIWEIGGQRTPYNSEFIGFAPFILERNKGLNVIRSDYWRNSFDSLFNYNDGTYFQNSVGSTFENPFPLAQSRVDRINLQSGAQAQSFFLHQHAQLTREILEVYRPLGIASKKTGLNFEYHFDNDFHHQIADIELLSNILASDKKRILVYAGGWHCENLTRILPAYGFREVCSNFGHPTNYDQLPVRLLDHVERDVNNNPLPKAKENVCAQVAIGKTAGTVKPKIGKKAIAPLKKIGKKLGKKKLGALVSFSKKKSTKV